MTTDHTAARRLGLALLIATISIAAPTSAIAQGATPDTGYAFRLDTLLDLETVIARTLAANPVVTAGEENVRTARSEGRVATGAYLPSLSLNSTALQSNIVAPGAAAPLGPSTAGAYSAGVSSSVELFTGGRRGADRARARADLGAAEANSISQRFSAILLAQRAYYEALRGTDLLAVADARVARAERGMRYAQDRVRAGTATRSDELRARLELTAGRQQLLAARDTMQTAAFALGRLVGADGPVGARRPASLDPRALSLSDTEVVRLAVDAAPIVQSTSAAVRATEASTRAARAQFAPDIRLTGGYNWAGQSVVIGAIRPGWTVGVGTSFPLFNGFQREDAVIRADAAAEIARATALDARRQVRAQAASLLGALRLAEQNISLASEAVTAAQEDLRVQTQRYRAGISTSLDQLNSELAVTQAELSLVAARYNYQVTRATLEALVGRTL
jgi:outer membrane protein TolC